ncbi:hypothetical protein DPMN_052620 [Dreissena polymorpha]|uniref:Uncharacterized protein n=1 Tax=Dreissena polymorpha TaxID=45954 RepID=A0A9D4CL79_DREPO|nr:hypothetical protein DPMN_052620 [Dreissena polymorpha]
MLYEVAITTVEALERTTSCEAPQKVARSTAKFHKDWTLRDFTRIELYGKTNKLQLPLSSLVEEFKIAKTCADS